MAATDAATVPVEKTEEDLRKEIVELHRQQREITERLRDPRGLRRGGFSGSGPRNIAANGLRQRGFVRPADRIDSEDQPPGKRRLSSAVVKLEDGEIVADGSESGKDLTNKGTEVGRNSGKLVSSSRGERNISNLSKRDGYQKPTTMDFEVPPAEHVPRVLPKNEDPSLVKRNKRMLGQLLGTLERFREEDMQLSGSEAYMRRSDSLKRAEQRAREESERLRQQEREQIAEKRKRDLILRARLAAKAEEKRLELLFLRWSEHQRKLGNFIRFLTAPWLQSQVNRNMPSMCYCKVPNKRGQMMTAKSVFANCRLFNGRSYVLIRGLSTSVEVDKDLEQEVPPEKKWAAMGRKNQTTLYQRLSALGWKKGYVAQTINAYIREGKAARKDVLETCIKELRRYKKHHLALEILEWMEKRKMNFGFGDHARRLDLTAKVHGIAAAENYFDGLSPSQKNNNATYGALLNCYCNEKMASKACDIFEKMDEMEIGKTSLSFNNIMSLYTRLGQPEKVPPLVQSMKEREIRLSTFTYNIWMKSYSSMNDIQGVERVFEEIKTNNETQCDWTTYSNLAMAYVKAGLNEKAELALKLCELKMKARPHDPEGYSWLITLYAKTLNHDEVHRVWKSLKSYVRVVSNLNYLTMIQALFKLNDVDGMKKCFEEWESTCSYYDTRLVNAVLDGYIKHHMIEEAKTTIRRAHERSNGPFFIAWEKLMAYGLNTGKTELALECLKAAIGDGTGCEWYPRFENVSKFFSCFKQEKDVDGAEKLCEYLKKLKPLDSDVYEMLLQTYIAAGRSTATDDIRKRIEEDGVELTTLELQNLLQNVCP